MTGMEHHLELLAELITTPKENVMDDQMERDHARDRRVKGLMDDACRSLDALLADEDARRRLARHMREGEALSLAEHLAEQSAHTVRVWD